MCDRDDFHVELMQFARRLDGSVGSVVLQDSGRNIYCIVRTNDALLLCQAMTGSMNRSSRRKLRKRLFDDMQSCEVEAGLIERLGGRFGAEKHGELVLHSFGSNVIEQYAVLNVSTMRRAEYLLYVTQRAFTEYIYRVMR